MEMCNKLHKVLSTKEADCLEDNELRGCLDFLINTLPYNSIKSLKEKIHAIKIQSMNVRGIRPSLNATRVKSILGKSPRRKV